MKPLLSLSLPVEEARAAWPTLGGAADLIGELLGEGQAGAAPPQSPSLISAALNELLELAVREASAEGAMTLSVFEGGRVRLELPVGDAEHARLSAACEALDAPEAYPEALARAARGVDDPTLAWRALGAEAGLSLLSTSREGDQLALELQLGGRPA